jgi:hypothetical protein
LTQQRKIVRLTAKQMERALELCRQDRKRAIDALRSIGENICGHEPLAAAFARGVVNEIMGEDSERAERSEE